MRDGSPIFRFVLVVGGGGIFGLRLREEDIFQGVRLLEAVASARAHMLFGMGWFDGWGEGWVVFLKAGGCVGVTGSGGRRL